jgi:hypothetical protein
LHPGVVYSGAKVARTAAMSAPAEVGGVGAFGPSFVCKRRTALPRQRVGGPVFRKTEHRY